MISSVILSLRSWEYWRIDTNLVTNASCNCWIDEEISFFISGNHAGQWFFKIVIYFEIGQIKQITGERIWIVFLPI